MTKQNSTRNNTHGHSAAEDPKDDSGFWDLVMRAIDGEIPTYFGQVPLRLIRPFDPTFHPSSHPHREKLMQEAADDILAAKYPIVWLYPQGGMFILSIGYEAYEAYRLTNQTYVPSFIFGDASAPEVFLVEQEPMHPRDVQDSIEAGGLWAVEDVH